MTRFDDRAFDALRRDADEVGRVRQRAAELLKTHRVGAFDGLGDVLRRVLPDDTEALTRVARILRLRRTSSTVSAGGTSIRRSCLVNRWRCSVSYLAWSLSPFSLS